METICSPENKLVKTLDKLKQRKYRYELGAFVLEGYRLVRDYIAIGGAVDKIIVSESMALGYVEEFPDAVVISDSLFDKTSETVSSQGIMAIAPMPKFADMPSGEFVLYLDRIRDPGNLGTIIRSAVACGFNDIILNDCVDVFNPKTIRSSMSAFARCNFIVSSQTDLLDGYTVVCADAKGEVINGADEKFVRSKICLVIGNEANGISDLLRKRADMVLALPMCDGVESLNAAVSASVIMYYLKYFNKMN